MLQCQAVLQFLTFAPTSCFAPRPFCFAFARSTFWHLCDQLLEFEISELALIFSVRKISQTSTETLELLLNFYKLHWQFGTCFDFRKLSVKLKYNAEVLPSMYHLENSLIAVSSLHWTSAEMRIVLHWNTFHIGSTIVVFLHFVSSINNWKT